MAGCERQGTQVATREFQASYQEKHLHHEDSQVVQQIAQRGCEDSCFLFYYSFEQEDAGSGGWGVCVWVGGGGGVAPVCGMITPGSETKVGVAEIMWYFGHIHKKGKQSFPRDPQCQKLNRMKLMPELLYRSRK